MELISQAVGKFQELDECSLLGPRPVRLRVMVPDLSRLGGPLPPFFFDGAGRTLVVDVELEGDQPHSLSPPSRHSPDHSRSAGEDESSRDAPSDDTREEGEDALSPAAEFVPSPTPHPSAGGATLAPSQDLALPPGLFAAASPTVAPPRVPRDDPLLSLGFPFSQYESNLCEGLGSLDIMGLLSTVLGPLSSPQAVVEGEEDCPSVGMEVQAPEFPRFVGMVCYQRSPGTPPADPPRSAPLVPATPDCPILEQVTVLPDTPVTGAKARPSRRLHTPHHLHLGTVLGLHGREPGPRWWSLRSRRWRSVGRRLETLVQVLPDLSLPHLPYLPPHPLVLVSRCSIWFLSITWHRLRQIVTWSSVGNGDPV